MSDVGGGGSANELKRLKEAIVDLYLAIKIRSTEEVSIIGGVFKSFTKFLYYIYWK